MTEDLQPHRMRERDRRHRQPVRVGAVRVKPLAFDPWKSEHVETVAKALGYFNFSDWRSGMRMKAQAPDDDNGHDGRRRVSMPMFSELGTAWRFLNWFMLLDTDNPARGAFFLMLGPNFGNLPVDPWVLSSRIMDCAFSVIVEGNKRGWL